MATANEIIHEIETAYSAYANAFNVQDMKSVVRYVAAPYIMMIGANPPMQAPTPEAVAKQFDGALADMLKRGWMRSDFKIVRVWPLSDNHALLMSDIIRYKADKSVLESGRYIYFFQRAQPTWRITGVTDVAPPMLGPDAVPRTYG